MLTDSQPGKDLSVMSDRRHEHRVAAAGTVEYLMSQAAGDWRFLPATVVDCSLRGLGLECAHPMAVDERFIVKVHMNGPRLITYTVKSCRPSGRRFRIGAELKGALVEPFELDPSEIMKALCG